LEVFDPNAAEHPPAENVKQLTIERDKLKKELELVFRL